MVTTIYINPNANAELVAKIFKQFVTAEILSIGAWLACKKIVKATSNAN